MLITAPCPAVGVDVSRAVAFLHPLSHPRRKCEAARYHPHKGAPCRAMRSGPSQERSSNSIPSLRLPREREKESAAPVVANIRALAAPIWAGMTECSHTTKLKHIILTLIIYTTLCPDSGSKLCCGLSAARLLAACITPGQDALSITGRLVPAPDTCVGDRSPHLAITQQFLRPPC